MLIIIMADKAKITENNLKQLAETVLCPKIYPHIEQFLSTATKNEIKGLKIAASIHKHQGKKKFRPSSKPSEPMLNNTIDLLKKKYMRSYYNSEYCKEGGPETDIFKYKKLSDLKCGEVLSSDSLENIQKWLNLKDEAVYQEYLLAFLRGVYSVYRSQEAVPSSSHRENFSWVRQTGKSESPLKSFVAKVSLPQVAKKNHRSESTTEGMKKEKRESLNESPKLAALKNLKGNKEITSWISNVPCRNTSLYQDSFIPLFYQKTAAKKTDFNTSIVCRLLPDRS